MGVESADERTGQDDTSSGIDTVLTWSRYRSESTSEEHLTNMNVCPRALALPLRRACKTLKLVRVTNLRSIVLAQVYVITMQNKHKGNQEGGSE